MIDPFEIRSSVPFLLPKRRSFLRTVIPFVQTVVSVMLSASSTSSHWSARLPETALAIALMIPIVRVSFPIGFLPAANAARRMGSHLSLYNIVKEKSSDFHSDLRGSPPRKKRRTPAGRTRRGNERYTFTTPKSTPLLKNCGNLVSVVGS